MAWGCGVKDFEVLGKTIGEDGIRIIGLENLSSTRMYTKCVKLWKGMNKKQKTALEEMDTLERMEYVYEHVGHIMKGILQNTWRFMASIEEMPADFVWPAGTKEVPDQKDEKAENLFEYKFNMGDGTVDLTARTYLGNLATTAGTWVPNNFELVKIRAFIMSLAYGLNKHPGDDYPTTEEDVITIIAGLPALTSCKSFWAIVFCRQEDSAMVERVMTNTKGIRGKVSDLVSHTF
jgi:hypothetical protein